MRPTVTRDRSPLRVSLQTATVLQAVLQRPDVRVRFYFAPMNLKMSEPPYSLKEDDLMLGVISNTPAIYNQSHVDYKNYVLKEDEWKKISELVGRPILSCKKRWRTIRDNFYKQKKFAKTTGRPCGRKYPLANKLRFLEYKQERKRSNNAAVQDTSEGSDNFDDLDEASSNFLEVVREDEFKQEDLDEHFKYNNNEEYKIVDSSSAVPPFKFMESDESYDPLSMTVSNKNSVFNHIIKLIERRNNEFDIVMKCVAEVSKTNEADDVDLFFKSMAMTVKKFTQQNIARVKLKVCQIVMEMELENN